MPLISKAFGDIITFTRASTASYFDSAGVLQSAAINAPRLDYNPSTLAAQGLLIEEQRTNSIRNNTIVGAVAGTPGTLPTNWTVAGTGPGTLTQQIVGTGTSNGITYIDFKYSGTTSTTDFNIAFEPATQIAALSGQTWSESIYLAIVGGSITNITNLRVLIEGRNAGGSTVESFFSASVQGSLTSTLQRFALTSTLANATTAFVRPAVRFDFPSGVAIDITLRIGLPQLELGAFATSVIPTTTAAVTRSADVASVNTMSPWYNQSEGTVYAESAVFSVNTQTQLVWQVLGGAASTSLRSPQTTGARLRANVGNTFSGAATGAAITNNTFIKSAVAWQGLSGRLQSGAIGEDITAATTVSATQLNIGNLAGGSFLNGYLRRITYYPRRLSNTELQTITA